MNNDLPHWVEGERPSARKLNTISERIRELQADRMDDLPPPPSVDRLCEVKILSAVSGRTGLYTAARYYGSPKPTPSGALAESNLGTVQTAADCLVWNLSEVGGSGTALVVGQTYPGYVRLPSVDGKQVVYVMAGGGILRGTVTDVPDCEGYVTAETPDEKEWRVYLVYPESSVYNKGVEVDNEILFMALPDTDPESPEGVAVGVEKDFVGLLVDETEYIRKIRNIHIINKHGPDEREDFKDDNLALVTGMTCADQVDLGLNWNGNDVSSYPETLKQVRAFHFHGSDENPGEVDEGDLQCVRFETSKPVGAAGDDSGILATVKGFIPKLKLVDGSISLEIPDTACDQAQEIKHTPPDEASAADGHDPVASFEKETDGICLTPLRAQYDGNGHYIGAADSAEDKRCIPYTTLEVVTDVECIEGVIVPTKRTIRFIGEIEGEL